MNIYDIRKEQWIEKLKLKIAGGAESYVSMKCKCESYVRLNPMCINLKFDFQCNKTRFAKSEDNASLATDGE